MAYYQRERDREGGKDNGRGEGCHYSPVFQDKFSRLQQYCISGTHLLKIDSVEGM